LSSKGLLKKGGYKTTVMALAAGTLSVQLYGSSAGATIAKHGKAKLKPVLIASGLATFSEPRAGRLSLKLTAQGKRVLKHTKHLKLTVKGTFVQSHGVTVGFSKGLRI
jgi:hypothetical protein